MSSGLDEVVLNEIAQQSQVNVDVVQRHYQTLVADLHHQARIHDYIPLLAMKLVRQHFRPRHMPPMQPNPTERQRILQGSRQMEFNLISYRH